MKNRTFTAALAATLILAAGSLAPAFAQSIFGLNFLGEHQFSGSARYRALGLSAYAVIDTTGAISANPAAMADLTRLTFSLVEVVSVANVRSGNAAAYEGRYQLPSVMIGVPVRKGLVLGVGYRTEFMGKGDFFFELPVDSTATAYETFRHRSGLFSVPLSVAWRPVSWARVAGAYQLERGSIKDDYRVEYYASVNSRRMRSFSGSSWSGSVLVDVNPRLSLGLGWKSGVAYEGEETFRYSRADLDTTVEWRFKIPSSWEAGAAYGITDRWWLSAHFWRRSAPEPRGFEQLAGSIGEERLMALGVEKRSVPAGGFFARIPLRLGFYENRWHLEYPPGRPVNSRFITFGTGFSLPGGPGAMDLSFEIGQIGSIGSNGVDERVFRMVFGLSASETWTRRRTER
jgi:hypothetical protein